MLTVAREAWRDAEEGVDSAGGPPNVPPPGLRLITPVVYLSVLPAGAGTRVVGRLTVGFA